MFDVALVKKCMSDLKSGERLMKVTGIGVKLTQTFQVLEKEIDKLIEQGM